MTDHELLELAAKAAGVDLAMHWMYGTRWNPLIDDGDVARLEAACRINVEWQTLGVVSHSPAGERMRETYADHAHDRHATRRLASVRAATEIGRSME